MTISILSLQKLMSLNLSTEQMAGVIEVLAAELAPLESRRAKDRARKSGGSSTEVPRIICGSSTEIPSNSPTPPKDNNNTNLDIKNNPPLSPPLPPNSRLHGTNPRAAATAEPDGFEAFWAAYPKRDGNADRKGAAKAFGAATKRADGHEVITRAAARYAGHCREKGKLGTEFVKQARSWLNGDLWREWVPQELPPEIVSSRFYVQTGTDAMDAWDAFFKRTKGKLAPRDQRGGWWFETQFPPHERAA